MQATTLMILAVAAHWAQHRRTAVGMCLLPLIDALTGLRLSGRFGVEAARDGSSRFWFTLPGPRTSSDPI